MFWSLKPALRAFRGRQRRRRVRGRRSGPRWLRGHGNTARALAIAMELVRAASDSGDTTSDCTRCGCTSAKHSVLHVVFASAYPLSVLVRCTTPSPAGADAGRATATTAPALSGRCPAASRGTAAPLRTWTPSSGTTPSTSGAACGAAAPSSATHVFL